jgi:MFS transporter, DHA2 family, multidrug resistance protein
MAEKQTDISFTAVKAAPIDVTEYGGRRALIVAGVMMAALLQTLDATIVNVALPTIEGNIGAAIDDGTWIITGYIISNVIAIPLVPYMLERFGRRQYYAACIIGFTVASFLCGTATSLTEIVLYRVIQGAFGGGLIATSQIILRDTFGNKGIGTSSALFGIALTVGPALGPTVGGLLTDSFSWPWVFDINIIPGAIATFIVLTTVRNPTAPRKMSLDVVGVALLTIALGSMQYVLDEGERNDWFDDSRIVCFTIAFVAGLSAFILWELRGTKSPIVDLRIFRYGNVRFGTIAAILLGIVIFGPTVMMPQYVQGVLGFTATLSGLLVFMRALPVLLLTPIVARLATTLDFRWILVLGFVLSASGFAAIALHMTTQSEFGTFASLLAFSGVGQALLLVPLLVGILPTVPPVDAPKASSFISLSVQLGGSIASTMLVTIFDRRTYFHSDILRGALTLARPAVQALAMRHASTLSLARVLQQQAVNAGFADAIFSLAPMAIVGALVVFAMRRSKAPLSGPIVLTE